VNISDIYCIVVCDRIEHKYRLRLVVQSSDNIIGHINKVTLYVTIEMGDCGCTIFIFKPSRSTHPGHPFLVSTVSMNESWGVNRHTFTIH